MKSTFIALLVFLLFGPATPVMSIAQNDNGDQSVGKYGEDSITCVMNISLYREFYKQWKASGYKNQTINDAIKPWRWVFLNCPKGTQNTYIDGVNILEYLIEKETDPAKKEKIVDTLMMLYDQRIQYFGKEGYVLGRKGVDLYKYRPEAYEDVFNALSRSIELEGNNSAAPVLVYYFRSAVSMVKNDKADTALIVDSYLTANEIIEYNMEKYAGSQAKLANWEIVKGNIELTFEPYATCEDLIPVYRKKFNETPDDIELLKKITEMLDKKKCQEDPLFFETSQKLYELEPTPESAYLLGKMLLKEGNYAEAVEYFKQTEGVENDDLKAKAFKYMAEAYRAMKQFPTARTYALKTAEIDPEDGEVYILIGDMYAESAKDCGDNDLTTKVAYWAAVDKYYRAKSVDPDLSELANRRISSYSVYFPTQETIFFYDLKEGDEYTVECWINERTKVRAAKAQ
jgi:tetratricopeptide (TPR) repeat protein